MARRQRFGMILALPLTSPQASGNGRHDMSITLPDSTKAQLEWTKDGRRSIEFKSIGRTIILPFATTATIGLVQKLYAALKM